MPRTCIVLLSGGLDSLLVLRLMTIQNINTVALHTVNCFHGTKNLDDKLAHIRRRALDLGAADVVFPNITPDVIAVTKNPKHGYGKHLNACIDCRLRTMREAFNLLQARNADFVVSGEVIGQRPMSQRKDAITLANREIARWGYPDRLLRPLCAKLLPKTIPESEGWVDPDRLYDISGRGRETQMALAEELAIGDYPAPAGGCLLTDPGFSEKLAVLMTFKPDWNAADAELLKVGRHYQIHPETKLVASRNEDENYQLRALAREDDRFFINAQKNGALVLLRGTDDTETTGLAASLAVHYSKMRETETPVRVQSFRIRDDRDVDPMELTARSRPPEVLQAMQKAITPANPLKTLRLAGEGRNRRKRREEGEAQPSGS